MALQIVKARRVQRKAMICLEAASGGGKTFTALELAVGLARRENPTDETPKILLVDTENFSSTLYSDRFAFDVINLTETTVENYLEAIAMGGKHGYSVVVVDSLTHAWQHLLEEHENVQRRDRSLNSFSAWNKITPIFNRLIQGVVKSPIHTIVTLRSKTEYIMEEQTRNGRTVQVPKRVGMAANFRQGSEYEFDIVGALDQDHTLTIHKTRLDWLDEKVIRRPGQALGREIADWLDSGRPVAEAPEVVASATPPTKLSQGMSAGMEIAQLSGRDLVGYLRNYGSTISTDEAEVISDRIRFLRDQWNKSNVGELSAVKGQGVLKEEDNPIPPPPSLSNGGVLPAVTEADVDAQPE